METPFELVFLGTTKPPQPVDPARFAVVIHYREVWPAEDDCIDDWQAMEAWAGTSCAVAAKRFAKRTLAT